MLAALVSRIRFGILPALASNAVSIGTGNPEQSTGALARRSLHEQRQSEHEAGQTPVETVAAAKGGAIMAA